jgi:serine/threonine protein kinase
MSLTEQLATLALTPVVEGALQALGQVGGEHAVEAVAGFLGRHFLDQSQRLPNALGKANSSAWKAFEVALAGESLWTLLDKAENKAFRAQVRAFLDDMPLPDLPGAGKEFRQQCLRQLRAARKAGLFDGALDAEALARLAGEFARFANPEALLEAEAQVIAGMAEECRQAGYAGLGQLVALRIDARGTPLLVAAVRFFFRREVETDPQLFQGLAWAKLEALQAMQERRFAGLAVALADHAALVEQMLGELQDVVVETHGVVLDIQNEVQDLARRFDLLHRELRPRDSLSIGSEAERRLVKQLIARYRALPETERRRLPDLLGAIGKLEVAAGFFDAARQDFQEAARLSPDQQARAEAHFNAYHAALEEGNLSAALVSLQGAAALDPARFAPFPLAKYQPERILGAGGFGVAFLCRNRHSGSRVVVKALRRDTLEREVADVFREARVLEELEHPAVIRLRDCDFADAAGTRPYLVMDYFEGPTLGEHVEKHGALSHDNLLTLVQPIAEALRAAHSRGIFHRDVKPANVLVRRDQDSGSWRVKLIDFGLALKEDVLRGPAAGQSQRTVLGYSIAGTMDYAAPEQVGRLPGVTVGPYTDVFAFGKTCCFALFKTTHPLRRHWREIPEGLADLLEQCLCEEPRDRLPSFDKVLERLGELSSDPDPGPAPVDFPPEPKDEPQPVVERLKDRQRDWWRAVPGQAGSRGPEKLRLLLGHEDSVQCVHLNADGRRLLSGGDDGTVRYWDVPAGKELCCLKGHTGKVRIALFLGHYRFAISAGEDKTVRFWDLDKKTETRFLPDRTNRTVVLSPDCRYALSGSITDGMIRLWEVNSGRELRRFKGHMSWVTSLAFSASGQHALSGSADGTARLWDVDTGREVRRFQGHSDQVLGVVFAPAGNHAATCGADRTVRVWDLRSGRQICCFDQYEGQVAGIAFASNGRFIVTSGDRNSVQIWEWKYESWRALPPLQGHLDKVTAVAVSSDSRLAASASTDKTIIVWSLPV